MLFLTLNKFLPIKSKKDLYQFWLGTLAFRKGHRHAEKELAHYVFLKSNESREYIHFDPTMDDITYEFAALETPDKNQLSASGHADKLWKQIDHIVNKEYLKLI